MASSSLADTTAQRLPLEVLPAECKYITPEGIGQVYDVTSSSWMTFAQYQRLVAQTDDESRRSEEPSQQQSDNSSGNLLFSIMNIESMDY